MKGFFFATTALLGTFAAAGTQARDLEPLVVEPASRWHLDLGENRCRLARTFGEEGEKLVLIADQWDPSETVELVVAGAPFDDFRKGRATTHRFDHGGDVDEYDLLGFTFEGFGSGISRETAFVERGEEEGETGDQDASVPRGLPAIDAEGAENIEWLTVSQVGRRPVRLHLGSLKAPLTAMNACMSDLVRQWGFDVEEQRSIVTGPEITNLAAVADRIMKVYPAPALNKGAQANFHLRLTVDDRGQIEKCTWLNQTLADDFDLENGPCRIFERYADFEPARDVQGAGVRSYWTTKIVYRMGR